MANCRDIQQIKSFIDLDLVERFAGVIAVRVKHTMSHHSRTSSDIESIPYADIMPVFIKQFCKDFDFKDVQQNVKNVLTLDEFEYISKETGKAQIFHLLWVLQNKHDHEIKKFLERISYDYKWLVDEIEKTFNSPDIPTEQYLEAVKKIRYNHQNFTDYNIHRTQPYLSLRSALRSLSPRTGCSSVVLLGELGSGKKWLVLDVCSEFTVLQAMNFKIFWVDTKDCQSLETDFHALNVLMLKLNPDHIYVKETSCKLSYNIMQLQKQLRELLKSKAYLNCLLVLTNVQNMKTVETFNLGCKRLIITRYKMVSEKLSAKMNKHLCLDKGLTFTEFRLLLDRFIDGKYKWQEYLTTTATDIYYLSNGDPYLLSIIARHLREKKSNWSEWRKYLANLQIPDKKFKNDIELSLEVLTPDQLQRYATFAIFPHCIGIPVKLMAALWNCSLSDAEDTVHTFHKYSFVKKELLDDNDTIICYLKFAYSSFIKSCSHMQTLIKPLDLHRCVIEYYNIEQCLSSRSEVDLFNIKPLHDHYFFKYLSYHLQGAKYYDLFPEIYLDFGFLGQKMRANGLLTTISDLRDYKNEITGNGTGPVVLKDIIDFLAKVEEKIYHTPDTCLLQYALMCDKKTVQRLALKQIEKFPRRAWFVENGNFHQRRFIVNLKQTPKIVRLLAEDLCIIVLESNDTYLVDISLDCTCGPLLIIKGSAANIVDICLFDRDNFLLTLDDHGQLRLWCISNERKRSLTQRRDSTKKFNPFNSNMCSIQMENKPCKQHIDELPFCKKDRVVAFHIEVVTANELYLHVALKNGDICVLSWHTQEQEFQFCRVPILSTKFSNTRFMYKIFKKYYMLMNNASSLSFWNLQDGSNVATSFDWPQSSTSLITYEVFNVSGYTHLIFIFTDKIRRLSFHKQRVTLLKGELQLDLDRPDFVITCAKLSPDCRYLVLGTKTGLAVYDAENFKELLRSMLSEHIRCVDVYDLDDQEYKCMIVCGVKNKRILYLLCLRQTLGNGLGWQHSSFTGDVVLEEQTSIRLLGQKLFDICYGEDGDTNLIAADSKNRIHHIHSNNTSWSIIKPTESTEKITAVAASKRWAFVGYKNGSIFNVYDESTLEPALPSSAITFLKLLNDRILVASSSENESTLIKDLLSGHVTKYQINTQYCYMVLNDYLILINNFGAVVVLKTCSEFEYVKHLEADSAFCVGDCDYQNDILFLASNTDYYLRIIRFNISSNGNLEQHKCLEFKRLKSEAKISSVAASTDATLLAVGLAVTHHSHVDASMHVHCNGDIEIYKILHDYELQFIYCLKSHQAAVCALQFAPSNEVLVSVAEQLCVWNISYVQNNPLTRDTFKRRSSRFSSQRSSELEEVDANVCANVKNKMFLSVENASIKLSFIDAACSAIPTPDTSDSSDSIFVVDTGSSGSKSSSNWENFIGPLHKPELLTCIKFDGNRAEKIFTKHDFTQFNTIDNEGVYYNLSLLTDNHQQILRKAHEESHLQHLVNHRKQVLGNDINHLNRVSVGSNNSGCDVVDAAPDT